jgi:glutathione S-transferase
VILVGQYDSPFVRRVGISLRVLGFDYAHDTRSVFGDFDAMRKVNPLGRIPSLVLDDGEVLVDSAAILDWLDQSVGPQRALTPTAGPERRRALQLIALAAGAVEKAGAAVYERMMRPEHLRWPDWIDRCRTQAAGGVAKLEAEPWPDAGALTQAEISTACLVAYLRLADPDLLGQGRYPALEALSERCEARPEFAATRPTEYQLPNPA